MAIIRIESEFDVPTPLEFVKHLLMKEDNLLKSDANFKPQTGACPFCAIEWDFIGKMENYKEDFLNLLKQSGTDQV